MGSWLELNGTESMTAKSRLFSASTFVALVIASSALADGVEVGGNLVNVTVVGRASNVASGMHSQARQSIGSIAGNVKVGGSIKSTTVVGEAVNLATGVGTKAETYVGSVQAGTRTPGSVKQTVVVRKIINSMSGFGSSACVSVGYGDPC